MHFLFVYPAYGVLGGIETLMARVSRWLVENGHEVTVLTDSEQNLGDLLSRQTRCIALGEDFRDLCYYYHAERLWKRLNIPSPNVIKSFNLRASWIACQLAAIAGNACKVIAGIYAPNVFKVDYGPERTAYWMVERLHLKNFIDNIPSSARVFCWADDMEEFNEVYHQRGVLWPLPIDTKQFLPAVRRPRWGNLVSIGRISFMKEYNLYMIDIVRSLREKGYDVTWSVYGEGTYEPEVRRRIKDQHLEGVIQLHGLLPYEKFWQALEDAYVFVGMGTAILEASFFGVPNVFARPYDREGWTYGPVYRLPLGYTVPLDGSQPSLKVIDEIERVLRLSPTEYAAEEARVRKHVQGHDFETGMQHFLKLVQEAESFARRTSLYLANYPLYFVRRMKGHPDPVGSPGGNGTVSRSGGQTERVALQQ